MKRERSKNSRANEQSIRSDRMPANSELRSARARPERSILTRWGGACASRCLRLCWNSGRCVAGIRGYSCVKNDGFAKLKIFVNVGCAS